MPTRPGGQPRKRTGFRADSGLASGDWKPAFEGQRPPFQKGNMAHLSHGAHSARIVNPRAEEIKEHLLERVPHLDTLDEIQVALLARLLAQIELLDEYLDEHGLLDEKGRARPAASFRAKLLPQAANIASKLGLDPLSRARLKLDTAEGEKTALEALRAGQKIVEQRRQPAEIEGSAS